MWISLGKGMESGSEDVLEHPGCHYSHRGKGLGSWKGTEVEPEQEEAVVEELQSRSGPRRTMRSSFGLRRPLHGTSGKTASIPPFHSRSFKSQ